MSKIKKGTKSRPATMEEVNANHDAWWNSLTNEQKQILVDEQLAMEKNKLDC